MVNGADANTAYHVVIVFIDGGCVDGVGTVGADFGPTGGVIEINAKGNGHARASFPREFLDTLPDQGFGPFPVVVDVAWQLRVGAPGGDVAYQTPCTTVTIDGPPGETVIRSLEFWARSVHRVAVVGPHQSIGLHPTDAHGAARRAAGREECSGRSG